MHLYDVAQKDRIVSGLKLKIVYSSFWSAVERLNFELEDSRLNVCIKVIKL
jgi:hypothetical protein